MDTQVNQILFPGDTTLSYLALAGATCMIYDHLTTLDVEIEVVWESISFLKTSLYLPSRRLGLQNRPKWQIPQILFFLNRYVGLALQIYTASFFIKNLLEQSTELYANFETRFGTCLQEILGYVNIGDIFNLISGGLAAVTFFAMHGIMVYRISSMYTHDRKVLRILVIAYATEFLSLIIIQLLARVYGSSDMFVPTPIDFCGKAKYTTWIFIIWIPVMLFEFLIFGLALALGIRYYRAAGSHSMFPHYRNCNRKAPLLYILLRDSIIFPFIFSLFCILNLVIFCLTTTGLRHVMAHISFVFPVVSSVIFGSRLILNLRESYYEPYDQEFSIRVDTIMDWESDRNSLYLFTLVSDPTIATPPTADG